MTINPNNATLAAARELMERALIAPNGVKVSCKDHAEAVRWQRAVNQARTAQRRVNRRVYDGDAGIDKGESLGFLGTGAKGNDPDAIRTHYDSLTTWIEPDLARAQREADAACVITEVGPAGPHILYIGKPDLAGLKIEDF